MKKFLFDTVDFDDKKNPEDLPAFTAAELAAAREDARQQGYAQGQADATRAARDSTEEKISGLLSHIGTTLTRLLANEDRRETERCVDAARLALHIAHKLMPQLARSHGMPEIERVVASALDARREEPRIAITVATSLLDPLKARIDQIRQDVGFAGKIIVISDDAMALSDCRIEWADGGSERSASRLMAQIEQEFSRAIAGMHGTLETPDTDATDTPPQ